MAKALSLFGTPGVAIYQVGLECLDVFRNIVATGTIGGPYKKATPAMPNRKPQWQFYAYGENALRIFQLLAPWLSSAKRSQAATVFADVLTQASIAEALVLGAIPRSERIAWAGGFFDAEGCFSKCGDGLNARINHTDLVLLERFRDSVGFGKIYGPYKPHHTSFGKKDSYVFTVSGFERVQALFALLWCDIGSAKRSKAIDLLTTHRTYWKCGHRRGPTWKMHCPNCFKPGPKPGTKYRRRVRAPSPKQGVLDV